MPIEPIQELSIEPQYHTGGESGRMDEANGSVFDAEGNHLYSLAAALGGPVLVLGVARGVSDRYIACGLQKHGGNSLLCSVDILEYWRKPDVDRWFAEQAPNVTRYFWCGRSEECDSISVIRRYGSKFTFAFIDADHRYQAVLDDMAACDRLGIKMLVHHDTAPKIQQEGYNEPRRAVMDYIAAHPEWVITRDCQDLCGLLTMEKS